MITDQQFNELKGKLSALEARYQQHTHNKINSFPINPKDLLGFSIYVVSDASVAPTAIVMNGMPIFQTDNHGGAAHWYLWVQLPNVHTVPTSNGWHYIQLT
jgi:hypothetical protein